ncbi:MAG: esterase-like activity of phytase family protein [Bacteroidota bacterium]
MRKISYLSLLIILCNSVVFGQVQLSRLATYQTGIFDESAAEIVTYDAGTQQLFFSNGDNNSIDVLDISDPQSPTLVQQIDLDPYGGGVNSVAAFGGIIAVAMEATVAQDSGAVVFFDPSGNFQASYTVGALPDMITFNRAGDKVIAACEGEPNDDYNVDPEGCVSIVDISGGVTQGVVTHAIFTRFNDLRASLENKGVRIFGLNATVAQDLEPEYVAVDESDTIAYVACQENNAMAVVNLNNATVLDIIPFGYKDHRSGTPELTEYELNTLTTLPSLGSPVYGGGQPAVSLSGFSGLYFDEASSTSTDLVFYAIPDRGPNDGAVSRNSVTPATSQNLRPFKLPNYQARIVKFTIDVASGSVVLDANDQIFLTHPNGRTPISGKGNAPGIDEVPVTYTDASTDFADSSFVDGSGTYLHLLEYDQYGGDFEGILIDDLGNYWLCDEYRPAIYKFSSEGVMLNRFIAEGTKARVITDDIFFSEWGEGSSNNKYLEFYNGTGDTVDLDNYFLANCANGCNTGGEYDFYNDTLIAGEEILPNEVFVIAHPSASADILARADKTFQFLSNGNDTWAILRAMDSTIVDQVGDTATSGLPDGWDVAGVPTATKDYTLIRKHYILSGSDDWAASAGTDSINSEWIVEVRPTADTVLSSLGTHMDYGTESLPAVYGKRWPNRGFEAIAYDDEAELIYAFIQSPMYNPDNSTRNNSDIIRILAVDTAGVPQAEYVYLLERNRDDGYSLGRVDKIGDAVYVGDGKFKVLERDSSVPGENTGQKYIFEIDIRWATNILGTPLSEKMTSTGPNDKTLEMMTAFDLDTAGIRPVFKHKILNLPSIGYLPSDKPEGLAQLPDGSLAVLNDNDFGLAGAGVSDNSTLGIIEFSSNYNFDASNRDDSIRFENWPTLGMYQPDAITTYNVNGTSYILTANEGDARDYDGFSEEERIGGLMLNPTVFTDPDLQDDENLGRLNSTLANGDLDGDGTYEYLYSYGARSFSIFDQFGNQVYDNGDEFAQTIANQFPDQFNSTNDDNDSFDNRSDDKASEPEAIELGEFNGTTYAFIGLERMGGIMVYDVTDPLTPSFVDYELFRNFTVDADSSAAGDLGPEDIIFIDDANSPGMGPLVVAANEVSGTITIYRFGPPVSVEDPLGEEKAGFAIYPNPNNGETLYMTQVDDYSVFDLMGREYLKAEQTYKLDISTLSAGVYIIRSEKGAVKFVRQ